VTIRLPGRGVKGARHPRHAERELHVATTVAASAERVWEVLADLDHMPEWSPELVRMVPLKPGGLQVGQWYLGVNRRGAAIWPTRNVVREVAPGRRLVWDTTTSGARWIYRIEEHDGTSTLSLTRAVPVKLTVGARVFAGALLGGSDGHSDELEDGMHQTLHRIADLAEH
jgi:uncharacterized protein YndB with AHSA1/START domain